KEKFFDLGGFDNIFFPFYLEETDLCYRAWKMGWRTIYEPNSMVYHFHDKTIGKKFKKFLIKTSFRKNQYLFIWKNITDFPMLLSHLFEMIIPKLLIPNLVEWAALFWAIKQLPEAFKKRIWNKKAKLSDREVFAKTAYLLKHLK
ncbi:MAG: glycosyltransferase family 2 protein, partial [Minisyncoccales bacterium]